MQILNNNNENNQHTLINNVGVSDTNLNTLHINNINSTTLAPHNIIFEFYYHLPNDTRIYRVTAFCVKRETLLERMDTKPKVFKLTTNAYLPIWKQLIIPNWENARAIT
ncbi:uncharacterized protein OCT59_027542 [Rhizophagus irregularis]|uniref:uncharacterized protein n=1 Tax=Rhizophagus irregularis TaxID=588596 RepID=UPI001C18C562|nr:hypothetical protein OCT59_027542 [Rhizophagus irregularis]CAB4387442.1 unnamed protein product [Rhizophagus irregularis]CAB5374990.1 unnamed protein product [Rhizophagus irregularis]